MSLNFLLPKFLTYKLSKVNYKNAANFFISRGITGAGDTDQIEAYDEAMLKFAKHLPS